jgi:hypothetical protein
MTYSLFFSTCMRLCMVCVFVFWGQSADRGLNQLIKQFSLPGWAVSFVGGNDDTRLPDVSVEIA